MKTLFYMIASVALVFGCQANDIFEKEYAGTGAEFTAEIENGLTRTAIDNDNNIIWSLGDQVSIFNGNTVNVKYKVSDNSAGKTSASLTKVHSDSFSAGSEISNNVAFYPYGDDIEIAKSGTGYNITGVTIPSDQAYAENSFASGIFPMAAITASESNYNLTFRNVCGVLKLQLTGTDRIKSISLNGNSDEVICGDAKVYVSTEATPTIQMIGSGKTVTLDCSEGVQLSESNPTIFDIVLPPVTFSNGFTALIKTIEDKEMIISTVMPQTITRSSILRMPAKAFAAETNIFELSASGTANCYIVNKYGKCQFDATKKGHTNEPVGTIASAEVLWESFGNNVQPIIGDIIKDVTVNNGIVSFTANGKDGNAVIAVKDASGTILWSWHIWVCEGYDPVATAHEYFNNAGTVMDRNLGATSATKGDVKALGLLYQWGRKDPFLGGQSIGDNAGAKSTTPRASAVVSTESFGTIDFSVKNPMTFIKPNNNNRDWYYSSDATTDNMRWTADKSIYDPCPNGWRVPYGGNNGLWSKALDQTKYIHSENLWDNTNKGWDLGGLLSDYPEVWYPASGYIDIGSTYPYGVGSRCNCWSCTPYDYGEFYFLIYSKNGHILQPSVAETRAYGFSVRCVVDSQ